MNDYLDDLSEDWPSHPPSLNASTTSRRLGSSTSRIPRSHSSSLRIGSISIAKPQGKKNHAKQNLGPRRKSALSERTFSQDNIVPSGTCERHEKPKTKSSLRRSMSAESAPSVAMFSTVAKKPLTPSPKKLQGTDGTPEWRRRLLMGEMGYGERKDLFAPAGIESIFQKPQPPPHKEPSQLGRGLSFLNHLETMPSSPPWPPSSAPPSFVSPSKPAAEGSGDLGAVNELEEGSESSNQDGSVVITSTRIPNSKSRPAAAAFVVDEDDEERNEEDDVFTEPGSIQASVRIEKRNKNSAAFAEALASKSRNTSASSHSDSFSAVYISKHNTADGRIEYAPLDLSKSELAKRIASLGMRNRSQVTQRSPAEQPGPEPEDTSFSEFQSDDLPEDLPAGTPELVSIGDFITVKRGGYSDDGSFRRRPLSPSPLRPRSAGLHDSSQAMEEIVVSNPSPRTPSRKHLKDPRAEELRKTTSPLKIFGDHDTFTANKLQRRISQLEDTLHDSRPNSQNTNPSQATTAIRHSNSKNLATNAEYPPRPASALRQDSQRHPSTASQFGQGQLDDYSFPAEGSLEFSEENSGLINDLPSRSPSPNTMPPGSQQPFRFHVESVSTENDTFKHKRTQSKISATSTLSVNKRNNARRNQSAVKHVEGTDMQSNPSKIHYQEGKRPPVSPFKEPTPKRRRTLLTTDLPAAQGSEQLLANMRESHDRIQAAIGKKRKDARYGSAMNKADPEVLARRHILRPRNPTPSQRRDESIHEEIFEAVEAFMSSSPRLEAIKEHLIVSSPPGASLDAIHAKAVATEVAAFSEKMNKSMNNDNRKRSVTTQDFLNEAMEVMSFIRKKGRPTSQLDNLQESHLEDALNAVDGSVGSLTGLTFSRPPSREEGHSGWRSRQPKELDPQILHHLRKFQETDDDHFIASSVGSRFARQAVVQVTSQIEVLESQPPGLNIIHQRSRLDADGRRRADSSGTEPKSTGTNGTRNTHSSQTSVDSTLGRTTGSRKSETVATLAPGAVAHLIPEEVAGMSFDREKGIWVKNRSPTKEATILQDVSIMAASEDDPFGEIPDLTFDEEVEAKRLAKRHGLSINDNSALREEYLRRHRERDPTPLPSAQDETIQGAHDTQATETSTVPSQNTSRLITADATQGTSWSDHRTSQATSKSHTRSNTTTSFESVEHEIKINEDRDHQDHNLSAMRKITVSIPATLGAAGKSANTDVRDFEIGKTSTPCFEHHHTKACHGCASNANLLPHGNTIPIFKSSPLPPVNEHHELSFIGTAPGKRQVNFSVSLSHKKPSRDRATALVEASSSPCKGDLTYYLSELSDFTINQVDERETETRAVVKGSMRSELEDRFASGNQILVKALQDNEAAEPFWEDLRAIDLRRKGLTSLHLLDHLCNRLENADLSGNELNQLSGAPPTLRCLDVQQNLLSSLTWWGHLTNLQYLDVSGNDLSSLKGFACLVHLRELRADGNRIESLDGLHELDGLLKISLRGNKIKGLVDFEGFDLSRLEVLDLGQNEITNFEGMHWLPALLDLRLDNNQIKRFPSDQTGRCMRLKDLDLRHNKLASLSLNERFPNLERVDLDNNSLNASTTDLSQLKHLKAVSLRSQSVTRDSPKETTALVPTSLPDVSNLYLSLNPLPKLLHPDFMSLHHLELAGCGLTTLPTSFGLSAPNLRFLNLNYNALKDVRPLLNIKRLSVLLLAGNRLSRLRKTVAVLAKLEKIEVLDCRDNPFTVGFYNSHAAAGDLVPKTTATRPPSPEPTKALTTAPSKSPSKRSKPVQANPQRPAATTLQSQLQATPFSPPWHSDRAHDAAYLQRLDDDTKLRRRVYEMLLATSCSGLKLLDGMAWSRKCVMVKDVVWERLMALGVLKRSSKTQG